MQQTYEDSRNLKEVWTGENAVNVRRVCFASDSQRLFAWQDKRGWDGQAASVLSQVPMGEALCTNETYEVLRYNPENKRFHFRRDTSKELEPRQAEQVSVNPENISAEGFPASVSNAMFSPDRDWLAIWTSDHLITLWNTKNGGESRTLRGHAESIRLLRFSRRGELLAPNGFSGLRG